VYVGRNISAKIFFKLQILTSAVEALAPDVWHLAIQGDVLKVIGSGHRGMQGEEMSPR
jgi:hypothetical protein